MIGSLRGRLVEKRPPLLLLEVGGVGYELEAPMSTCFALPEAGAEVALRTHLYVREDQQTLFGFATEAERRLFRELLKISGVGAKLALSILSGISVEGFVRCVETEDKAALTALPGIGRKTAERLIMEMRDRIDAGGTGGGAVPPAGGPRDARGEAFDALVGLGYKAAEVRRMLDGADPAAETTEAILRSVLKAAAPEA